MGENSNIEWTDHTFKPWIGCTKVAPECKHCYAETLMDTRYRKVKWGPQGARALTSKANWDQIGKWDRVAEKSGVKARVFCASLADVFEDDRLCGGGEGGTMLNHVRVQLWQQVESTPNLIWLLLTKRPENIPGMVPPAWLENWPANVWTGTSAGCQETADAMIPALLRVPGPHFLSCEPMLGPVDLFAVPRPDDAYFQWRGETGCIGSKDEPDDYVYWQKRMIHWVICGGESGAGARPMHPDWARSLRDQCVAAGVPFFFKQWGEWLPTKIVFRDLADTSKRYGISCALTDICLHASGVQWVEGNGEPIPDGALTVVRRVGKKAAGRVLDGRTWDEMPAALMKEGAVR